MLIKPPGDIPSSDITPKQVYINRRQFIRAAAVTVAAAALASDALAGSAVAAHGRKFDAVKKGSPFNTDERPNSWEQITTYNNFYEFGFEKDAASLNSRGFKTADWTVGVEGECSKKASWHLEDILKGETLEERVYRHRCVEAWSMVIPWVGIPLANFIKRCDPTAKANYVEFTSAADPRQMPGVRTQVLRWPYVEGLRLDEALHPLTLLVVGLYDEMLPNQNGAPLRLAVPWKYGFKHIKSIVKIRFVERQPMNSWRELAPSEYGFFGNVNPSVDHPRWSQSSERRIGEFLRRKTQMFNGYGDQVASLYAGLDLRRNF